MKEIEECFLEDLKEVEVYQLVENALSGDITDEKDKNPS